MSYHDLPTGSADCELGRKIYMDVLEDRRGFRYDQLGIEDIEIWREIFEAIGKSARSAADQLDRPGGDELRAKVLTVFDKVIVDAAGVINAPQLADEICRIVKRRSSSVLTEDDGSGDPLPQGAMPPRDGAEGADPSPLQIKLRKLVDVVWNEATESTAVPSTKWADRLIARVFPVAPPKPVPDALRAANAASRDGCKQPEDCVWPACAVAPLGSCGRQNEPAPDAMRKALKPFAKAADGASSVQRADDFIIWQEITIGDLRCAKAALSAPVPPADGARREVETTLQMISAAASDAALRDTARLSSSPVVAAEPVAWRWRNPFDKSGTWRYIEKEMREHLALSLKVDPLYASPPVRGDREAMIRELIDFVSGIRQKFIDSETRNDLLNKIGSYVTPHSTQGVTFCDRYTILLPRTRATDCN